MDMVHQWSAEQGLRRFGTEETDGTAVAVGQTVHRGDRLGFVGSTGLSTGPHLHYEVLIDGRPTDPLRFIMPDVIAD